MRVLPALILTFVVAAGEARAAEPQINTIPAPPDVARAPTDATMTSSGLATKLMKPGIGKDHPAKDDLVTIDYTGWTADGKLFDSSVLRGKPETFILSVAPLPPGLLEGVQLMVPGETRRLWIPESLAYKGQAGFPKGMLVFDVRLIDLPNRAAGVGAPPTTARDLDDGPSQRIGGQVKGLVSADPPLQNPPRRPPSSTTPSRGRATTPSQQIALPSPLTEEKAFFYFIAIYGSPDNAVERYGKYFDAANYQRAMADEFERGRYAERIRARIADGVRALNFRDKFTLVGSTTFEGYTTLGEYSFSTHSFPLANVPYNSFCRNMDHSSGICYGTLMDVSNARLRDAVNGSEFDWSIPMSEADASAFIKTRNIGGGVNRRVVARLTYSITNKRSRLDSNGRGGIFSPYIYSVEVFTDESLTRRLGVITPQPGTPISAFMPETALAAQSPSQVIATYQYTAACREPYKCVTPIVGTVTLTDVGIELTGEQRDGSAKPSKHSFFEALAGKESQLWRANYHNATWGGDDFRVVWRPFWQQDYQSGLVFSSQQERDRFFVAVTSALQEWATKYAQFAGSKLSIDQRCEVNTRLVACPE